ncbi:MAG: LysM domain-containing protein [Pseudomonadota bacterium]
MRNLTIAYATLLRAASLAALLALLGACTAEPERIDEPQAEAIEAEEPEEVEAPAKPAPVLNPTVPLRYTVKKGDTLWSIASKFLKDPWQWPELWYVNQNVKNPHRIFPGDTLELFFKDGRPVLAQSQDAAALKAGKTPLGTLQLSPKVRDAGSTQEIPAIPIDVIRNFLTGPRLVTLDELEGAPYILDFIEEHIYGSHGQSAYVRGAALGGPIEYDVVRLGAAYRDPDDDALLGYEALPVGQAQLKAEGETEGDPATVLITKSVREASQGDRLLPSAEVFGAQFFPRAPAAAVGGRIISVYNGLSQIGQYQVVTLNRGTAHGLEPGHVLHVFQTGRVAQDRVLNAPAVLPDTHAGNLMVFKVTTRLSYALVMSSTRAIHVLDRVEKPE